MFFPNQLGGFDTLHPLVKMQLIHGWRTGGENVYPPEIGITSKGNIGMMEVYPDRLRPVFEQKIKDLKK